jgi:hypothetical protein
LTFGRVVVGDDTGDLDDTDHTEEEVNGCKPVEALVGILEIPMSQIHINPILVGVGELVGDI